jgi:hypothetical protein
MRRLCGIDVAHAQVSRANQLLDEELTGWRRLALGDIQRLILDVRREKIGHGGSAVSCAVAADITPHGRGGLLGVSVSLREGEVDQCGGTRSGATGSRGVSGLGKFRQAVDLNGAPGTTRTCDLLIRSQTLYPTELRAHPANLHKVQFPAPLRNPILDPAGSGGGPGRPGGTMCVSCFSP